MKDPLKQCAQGELVDWKRDVDGFESTSTVVVIRTSENGREAEIAPSFVSMIRKWVPKEQLLKAIVD